VNRNLNKYFQGNGHKNPQEEKEEAPGHTLLWEKKKENIEKTNLHSTFKTLVRKKKKKIHNSKAEKRRMH